MLADEKVVLLGEDIGGVFRVTEGLQEEFAARRVFDTPFAESGIVRTGTPRLPACLRDSVRRVRVPGVRPDRQPARQDARTVRWSAQASGDHPHPRRWWHRRRRAPQRIEQGVLLCQTVGLRVAACADPADAHIMIQAAIADNDPVIFYEPKRRYWDREPSTWLRRRAPRPLRAPTALPGNPRGNGLDPPLRQASRPVVDHGARVGGGRQHIGIRPPPRRLRPGTAPDPRRAQRDGAPDDTRGAGRHHH